MRSLRPMRLRTLRSQHPVRSLRTLLQATLLKYGLASVLSFLADYGMFALLLHLHLSIMEATYGARAFSCVLNFLLNRQGVFRAGGHPVRQFAGYLLLVILSATASGAAVTYLTARLSLPAILLKFCVEAVLFFANYLIQKKLIFRP